MWMNLHVAIMDVALRFDSPEHPNRDDAQKLNK